MNSLKDICEEINSNGFYIGVGPIDINNSSSNAIQSEISNLNNVERKIEKFQDHIQRIKNDISHNKNHLMQYEIDLYALRVNSDLMD